MPCGYLDPQGSKRLQEASVNNGKIEVKPYAIAEHNSQHTTVDDMNHA